MSTLSEKFRPIDVIAIIVIIGGLILKFVGCNGTVSTILTTTVLAYFGQEIVVEKIAKPLIEKKKTK